MATEAAIMLASLKGQGSQTMSLSQNLEQSLCDYGVDE